MAATPTLRVDYLKCSKLETGTLITTSTEVVHSEDSGAAEAVAGFPTSGSFVVSATSARQTAVFAVSRSAGGETGVVNRYAAHANTGVLARLDASWDATGVLGLLHAPTGAAQMVTYNVCWAPSC